MEVIVEEGCRTPRHSECQILADLACPLAPKKKKVGYVMKQRDLPKNGYFQPLDLEALFTIAPRREAFAWSYFLFEVNGVRGLKEIDEVKIVIALIHRDS
ncbi:hypothetical protein SO802_030073 [Lithocarpus litseifolius]|uniref:Uncharacterized protein n=1 Tax=Lithocarpus litseifolius TaxID=425828 RepID=A0AAW2BYA0_9ROSI